MSTQNDGWIKMRAAIQTLRKRILPNGSIDYRVHVTTSNVSMWLAELEAMLPEPPLVERTQREMDHDAWNAWATTAPNKFSQDSWHAALAYRDAQNAEDIASWHEYRITTGWLRDRLRKRCGLHK